MPFWIGLRINTTEKAVDVMSADESEAAARSAVETVSGGLPWQVFDFSLEADVIEIEISLWLELCGVPESECRGIVMMIFRSLTDMLKTDDFDSVDAGVA